METGLSLADVHVKAYDWEKDGSMTALSVQAEIILEDMSVNFLPAATGESEDKGWREGKKGRKGES